MKKIFATLAAAAALASCASNNQSTDILGGWEIISVNGTAVELSDLPKVMFTEDGTYHAFTGVNIVNGSYTLEGDVLTIGEGAMTRMAGDELSMATEDAIVAAASQQLTASRDGESLVLADAEGNVVFELVATTVLDVDVNEVCDECTEE